MQLSGFNSLKDRMLPQSKQDWKQENTSDLTNFENAMMHIGGSFFGQHAGLDPNDTNAIKEQAKLLLELAPKQEWSEEDEDILNTIINHFEIDLECIENDDIIRWLKSLNPQPKQKWSEEDEQYLNNAITACLSEYGDISDTAIWLKSLRPQTTWKPSEGQLECLEYAIEKAEKDWSPLTNNRIYLTLKSLKEQLEKL